MGVFFLFIFTPVIFLFARTFKGTFNPAKVFCYFWIFQIVLMSFILFPLLNLSYVGQIYILGCLLMFLIGSSIGSNYKVNPPKILAINKISRKKLKISLYFLIMMGFASTLNNVLSHGFSLSQLFDFAELLNMNNEMSVQRYSGAEESRSFISQIFGIFSSLCPLVGGFSYMLLKSRLSIFSLVPSICASLTSGAKMGVITAFALFISGIFVCSTAYSIKPKIKIRNIIYITMGTLLFFMVLILSMMFRIGAFDINTLQIVSEKFVAYSLGHLPAFDYWFVKYIGQSDYDYGLGTQTFLGIFHYLGFVDREQGLFQDFVEVTKTGGMTNVYTVFRIFINDFGFWGTLLWCFFMGIITQAMYKCLYKNKNPELYTTLMVGVYFFTFWSFVTSIFVYTTYFALLFGFYFVIIACRKKFRYV